MTAAALSPSPLIATLETRRGDTLFWRAGHDTEPLSLTVEALQKLEISLGKRADTWKGGLIGALAGIGVGALIGLAAGNYDCPTMGLEALAAVDCLSPAESAATGAFVGAIGGGGVGLLIGSTHKSEHWRAVSLEQIRVTWNHQAARTLAVMGKFER